jgi:hypothetical protein
VGRERRAGERGMINAPGCFDFMGRAPTTATKPTIPDNWPRQRGNLTRGRCSDTWPKTLTRLQRTSKLARPRCVTPSFCPGNPWGTPRADARDQLRAPRWWASPVRGRTRRRRRATASALVSSQQLRPHARRPTSAVHQPSHRQYPWRWTARAAPGRRRRASTQLAPVPAAWTARRGGGTTSCDRLSVRRRHSVN